MIDQTHPNIFGGSKAFFALTQAAPDAIINTNADSIIVYANPAAERVLGYEVGAMLGKPLDIIIPERYQAAHNAGMKRFIYTGTPKVIGRTIELVARRTDNVEIPIELSLSSWKEREEIFFTAIIRDISARKTQELALKQESSMVKLLQKVTSAANEAPSIDQAMLATLEYVCQHMGWKLGHVYVAANTYPNEELLPGNLWYPAYDEKYSGLREITSQTPLARGIGIAGKAMEEGQPIWLEDLNQKQDVPRKKYLLESGLAMAVAFPVLVGAQVVAVMEFFDDVSMPRNEYLLSVMGPVGVQLGRVVERVRAKEKMLEAAMRDPLTGLPNRLAFSDMLSRAMKQMDRKAEYVFAVLFIDLDRFKVVNDSLGHDAGDSLLVEIGNRLVSNLRQSDMVCRLGGDEFAVFIDDLNARTDGAGAIKTAHKILKLLQMPCTIEGEEVFTSASIGVAFGMTGYKEPEEILRDADTAMYRAKNSGKGRVEVFDPQMRDKVLTQLKLENDLRRAVENKEFFLNYQPVVSIATGTILGFEALIRWSHPTRGTVGPNEFIYMAEETGLIAPIGWWVLEEACNWLAHLHNTRPQTRHLRMNVNVSAVQLGVRLVDKVREILEKTGLNPVSLKLEITETCLVATESLGGMHPLEMLRDLGVELLIDDFGTGYSSLARLSQLPIDALKIDRSFVKDLTTSADSVEIAKCIIALASALGIDVIAEGVETVEQAEVLLKMGCEQAQGFHFSVPVPGDEADGMI